jgi:hypothetical protein
MWREYSLRVLLKKKKKRISIFQAIDELVCSKNPNLLLKLLVLRSWGWDLTIVGGQPKTPMVTSI